MTLDFTKFNEVLLIVPNNLRNKILDYFNHYDNFVNYKMMSLDEVRDHIYFSYDVRAVLYLMQHYLFNMDAASDVLESLYYLDKDSYVDDKLNNLVKMKEELDKEKLLYYDDMFLDYIKRKKIIVYGYSKIDKFYQNMLDKIDATIIEESEKFLVKDLYVLNTLEDEVSFVFYNISKLISSGVDINKIKLANVSEEYYYTLKMFSYMYNIPISFPDNSIYSSPITKKFLYLVEESKSFFAGLEIIKAEYDMTNYNNLATYNALFNISNKYNDMEYPFQFIFKCTKQEVKNTKIMPKKKKNQIELVNITDNIFEPDEYVFLLGFNQGAIPTLFKDDDFIGDLLKTKYNMLLSTTEEKNRLEKEKVINSIQKIKNLIISCKLNSLNGEVLISNLASEMGLNKIEYKMDYKNSYSKIWSEVLLSKELDNFIKFGIKSEQLPVLYNSFSIPYLTYDNKFTGINNNSLLELLKPRLTLSYTSIDNYYHCAFKYYLTNILKLDKYVENFNTVIGSLFHYILSICFNEDFDFSSEYDKYVSNLTLTNKEKFLLKKLKSELSFVIEQVKNLQEETGLTKLLLEKKITIDKSSVIPVVFTGIVDKIMYKEKENTLVSIVDYKTGNTNIDLYSVIYGFSMQLPIYLYLVKKSNLFKNVRFTGFYLQRILSNEIRFVPGKTYLSLKCDNLKLDGYSTSDVSDLEVFIPDYEKSSYVKSMRTNKEGFDRFAKVLSYEQMDKLISVIDDKIDEARDNILMGNFDINPKQIDFDKVGCNYCKFKDICYRCESDFVKLNKNKSLSFLGGEE